MDLAVLHLQQQLKAVQDAGISISLKLHAVGDFSLKKDTEEPAQQHLTARIRGLGG